MWFDVECDRLVGLVSKRQHDQLTYDWILYAKSALCMRITSWNEHRPSEMAREHSTAIGPSIHVFVKCVLIAHSLDRGPAFSLSLCPSRGPASCSSAIDWMFIKSYSSRQSFYRDGLSSLTIITKLLMMMQSEMTLERLEKKESIVKEEKNTCY